MAIVWIMSRDVEKVAAQKANPSSVNVLTFDDDLAFDAKSELWRALQEGALTATGRKNGSRQQIPALLWQDMRPTTVSASDESFSDQHMNGKHWHEVTVKRDDVLRLWLPPALETRSSPARQQSKLVDTTAEFDAQRPNWIELAIAPVHFRAMWDKGKYLPGTDLLEMASWFQYSDIGRVSISPDDGALFIEWDFAFPDGRRCKTTARYYPPGPGNKVVALIDANPSVNYQHWPSIPPELWLKARNLMVGATSLQERLLQEFRYAIDAGICQIFARVGGPTASFKHIPADIFRKYEITSWGSGIVGGAKAERDGQPPLFAIYAAPVAIPVNRDRPKGRGGRKSAVDWSIVRIEAARLMAHHGDFMPADTEWDCQQRLEDKLVEFCEKKFSKSVGHGTISPYVKKWVADFGDGTLAEN
jgi:hypothetical protein